MLRRVYRSRVDLLPMLLLVLGALTPVAYASPLDPSWIGGVYDDADYDDVVVLVMSAVAAVTPSLLAAPSLLPPPVSWVVASELSIPSAPSIGALQARAPPAS